MTILATDLFDRADNADLGATWDVFVSTPALRISNNRVSASEVPAACAESYNAVVWPDDQYSEVVLSTVTVGSSNGCAPAVRCSTSARTAYFVAGGVGQFDLFSWVAGTWTILGSYVAAPVLGDIVRIEASGMIIRAIINGVEQISVANAAIASGRAGIYAEGNALGDNEVSEWNGGDLTPEGTGTFYYQSRSNVPPNVRMG